MPRTNEEWTIEDAIRLNDHEEVVLAARPNKYAPEGIEYVTWFCTNGNNYFWGHYTFSKKSAKMDLCNRALKEFERWGDK